MKSIRLTEEAIQALTALAKPHEALSDTILRALRTPADRSSLDPRSEELLSRVRQYLPEALVEHLASGPSAQLVGQDSPVCLLAVKLLPIAQLGSLVKPSELVRLLNRHYEAIADVVYRNGGVVDFFANDQVVAYFGYPSTSDGFADRSVAAALDVIDAIDHLAQGTIAAGYPVLHPSIGLHYGPVAIGSVGSPQHGLDYTVIGDAVEVTLQVQTLAQTYRQKLLLTENLQQQLTKPIPSRLVDYIPPRHSPSPTRLYTVSRHLPASEQQAWEAHNDGMIKYLAGDLAAAEASFQTVLKILEDDFLAGTMVERCRVTRHRGGQH